MNTQRTISALAKLRETVGKAFEREKDDEIASALESAMLHIAEAEEALLCVKVWSDGPRIRRG